MYCNVANQLELTFHPIAGLYLSQLQRVFVVNV